MTIENWLTIIAVAGPVFGAIIGYYIKFLLVKKAQFSSQNAVVKRRIYQEYVEFILKFIDELQNSGSEEVTQKQQEQLISKMKKFHREAVLYASPKVINAYSDMLQNSYRNTEGGDGLHIMVLMTNVFKAMRKDIGLSNRKLGSGDIKLMRPLINDYDTAIKPKESGLLLSAKRSLNTDATREIKK